MLTYGVTYHKIGQWALQALWCQFWSLLSQSPSLKCACFDNLLGSTIIKLKMTDVEMKETGSEETKIDTKAPEEPTDRFYGK